jgi:hypothetical protein
MQFGTSITSRRDHSLCCHIHTSFGATPISCLKGSRTLSLRKRDKMGRVWRLPFTCMLFQSYIFMTQCLSTETTLPFHPTLFIVWHSKEHIILQNWICFHPQVREQEALTLLGLFVAFSFHSIFCLSFSYIHALSQFLLHTFLLPPVYTPWSQVFSCSYSDIHASCPVIKVGSF